MHAAHDAFALAERPGSSAWPFVASVGPETVALRWAGASVPEPAEPWRLGFDARVWVADRDAVPDSAEARGTAVLIGWFEETLVFVNTARAPGPLAVDGDGQEAELLRELIALQTRPWLRQPIQPPGQAQTALGEVRVWWPLRVEQHAIQLFGLAVARTFDQEATRQAIELVHAAAALDEARRVESERLRRTPAALPVIMLPPPAALPPPRPVPRAALAVPLSLPPAPQPRQAADRAEAEVEDWLRQVQAAAYEARRAGQSTQQADEGPLSEEAMLPDDAGQPNPEPLLLPGTPVITALDGS